MREIKNKDNNLTFNKINIRTKTESILTLKKLYSLHGYILEDTNNGYLKLFFNKKSIFADMLIIIKHDKISSQNILNILMFFESVSKKEQCQNYKLITMNGLEEECNGFKSHNLILEDLTLLVNQLINLYDRGIQYIEIFEHNRNKLEEIFKLWDTNRKVAAIQATGTGKSILVAKILQTLENQQVLYLAPSNYILGQFKQQYHIKSLNLNYMTYQKLMEEDIEDLNPDYIILDEYHRCGAEIWGQNVTALLEHCKSAKVLGLSATPVRYLDNMRDMTEEIFDGVSTEELNLVDAIAKGILPEPKYVSALYTLKEEEEILREKLGKSNNKELLYELDKFVLNWDKSYGVHKIIEKHITKNMNKFIVFCKNIEHLNEMYILMEEWFNKAGYKNINKYIVHSFSNKNDEAFENFKKGNNKNKIYLLFAINMLNEGIHIDDVSGVFLLRETISPILYFQQIGRAIQTGNRLNPVIFDMVNNFKALQHTNLTISIEDAYFRLNNERTDLGLCKKESSFEVFDETQDIISVFESIEERIKVNWDARYEELVEYKKKYNHVDVWKTPEYKELNNWCGNQRSYFSKNYLSKERIEKLDILDFQWIVRAKYWEDKLIQYIEFKDNDKKHTKALQMWVQKQRSSYKQKRLSKKKIDQLLAVGFIFEIERDDWFEMFEELKLYKKKFNDVKVPIDYVTESKLNLGDWVRRQTNAFRFNKNFDEIKKSRLTEIGFIPNERDLYWDTRYKEYLDVLEKKIILTKGLNEWIRRQRAFYKKGQLSEYKITLLQAIGFDLEKRNHNETFDHMFALLNIYKEETGHTNVPKKYKTTNGDNLGYWTCEQRQRLKDKLDNCEGEDKERIEKFDSIDFAWDVLAWQWMDNYKKYNEGKDFDQTLKSWVATQRKKFKENTLSEDKVKLLKETDILKKLL